MLRINRRIPNMTRGMPIGAAKNVRVRISPVATNPRPNMTAINRPIRRMRKLNIDQTMTNGRSRIGVLLRWVSTWAPFSAAKMYRQILWSAT